MKIKVYIDAGGYPSLEYEDVYEIPDKEWNAMTEPQRQESLRKLADDFLNKNVDYGAYPEEK